MTREQKDASILYLRYAVEYRSRRHSHHLYTWTKAGYRLSPKSRANDWSSPVTLGHAKDHLTRCSGLKRPVVTACCHLHPWLLLLLFLGKYSSFLQAIVCSLYLLLFLSLLCHTDCYETASPGDKPVQTRFSILYQLLPVMMRLRTRLLFRIF